MTDTKTDNTSDNTSATRHDKSSSKQAAAPASGRSPKSSRRTGVVVVILILLLVVAGLAAAVWYQQRSMHEGANALLGQAQKSAREAQAASGQAMQALNLSRQQAQEIEQMRVELTEAQQHLQSLEQALQMLSDSGTDIALVNDIDHLVSIAHQQLLLGGNVSNAIIALETAQAQLARANRPNLAALQQAINGDLDRLRAVSTIDINRLSSRIDELGQLIESAPLLIPDDAAPTVPPSSSSVKHDPAPVAQAIDPSAPWWKQSMLSVAEWSRQAWFNVKQDLGNFISVRRVDDAAALLMSPEQAGSLRDKLRLRLMTAQLALLMKQPDVWATETRTVVQLLQARYDINSIEGHRALRLALQLSDTSIQIELPTVANSQSAIQTLRDEHARSAQTDLDAAGQSAQPSSSTNELKDSSAKGSNTVPAADSHNSSGNTDSDNGNSGNSDVADQPAETPAADGVDSNSDADAPASGTEAAPATASNARWGIVRPLLGAGTAQAGV